MSSIADEISGALEELENDLADSSGVTQKLILPSGAEIPCVPSMEDVGTFIVVGRREERISETVIVRKSHFVTADMTTITVDSEVVFADNSTKPLVSGKKPIFRTKTYRVLMTSIDPAQAYYKINLGSAKS